MAGTISLLLFVGGFALGYLKKASFNKIVLAIAGLVSLPLFLNLLGMGGIPIPLLDLPLSTVLELALGGFILGCGLRLFKH